jgi:hypothetical protein
MARYANWHSGQVESLMSVGSTPTRATRRGNVFAVPWSNGNDTSLTKRKRGFDSLRDDSITFTNEMRWSASAPAASLPCKKGDRVRFSGGPLSVVDRHGLLVQRKDAWLATRRSGFDSPVVHYFTH